MPKRFVMHQPGYVYDTNQPGYVYDTKTQQNLSTFEIREMLNEREESLTLVRGEYTELFEFCRKCCIEDNFEPLQILFTK